MGAHRRMLHGAGRLVVAVVACLSCVGTSAFAWGTAVAVATPVAHADVQARAVSAAPAKVRRVWPRHGQAAYVLGTGHAHSSPRQKPVPIASVAKVMTAYLVLKHHPITGKSRGFRLTVTRADVVDTARRVREDQSVVAVSAGEKLTERQALAALLLPSANNVAVMLARRSAGSLRRFVREMNTTARSLGMRHTTYTDPSGFKASTRSTAADQLTLALLALRNPFFAAMVDTTHYHLPVAGTVRNTDTLLGTDGFVGVKTGSDDAAGGCFVFRSRRERAGHVVDLTGVVLGQHGGDLIAAGLHAARTLTNRIAPKHAPAEPHR